MKQYLSFVCVLALVSFSSFAWGNGKTVVVHLKNNNSVEGELSAVAGDSLTIVTGINSKGREIRRIFRITAIDRVSVPVKSPETTPLFSELIGAGVGLGLGTWGGLVLTAGSGTLLRVVATVLGAAIGAKVCLWIVMQQHIGEKNLDPSDSDDRVVLETWALLHESP